MRPGEQHRRLVPRRIDRRQHRDIDIARLVAEQLRGLLLAAGRDRIDVEEIRLADQDAPLTDCAASTLDAAVTAAMTMSASRTASAAEVARRTPIASAALASFSPSLFGNRMSHADIRATVPASRRPAAIAWPASPKPMKHSAACRLACSSVPRFSQLRQYAICAAKDRYIFQFKVRREYLDEPPSCRDRLEQALTRIADPNGRGRARLSHGLCRVRPAPRPMPPMRAPRAGRASARSTASSSASRICSTSPAK